MAATKYPSLLGIHGDRVRASLLRDIVLGAGAAFDPLPARGRSTFQTKDQAVLASDLARLILDRNATMSRFESDRETDGGRSTSRKVEGKNVNGQDPRKLVKAG